MARTFNADKCYTRNQISRELGGGIRDYLPHRDCEVVCGCFRTDLNPDAPGEILPEDTPDKVRWAKVFASQKHSVPVFLKIKRNCWQYAGMWHVKDVIGERGEVKTREQRTGRKRIAMILRLVEE